MKKYKMLLELARQEETEMGAVPIMESIKLAKDFGNLAKKSGYDCYVKGYPKEKLNYVPTGKTIKIKTIADITKLTEQQFEFFIDDLREYCKMQRDVEILKIIGLQVKTNNYMTWLDTGLNERIVDIKIQGSNKI